MWPLFQLLALILAFCGPVEIFYFLVQKEQNQSHLLVLLGPMMRSLTMVGSVVRPPPSLLPLFFSMHLFTLTHRYPATFFLLLLPVPAAPGGGSAAGREDERHLLLLCALYLLDTAGVLLPGASARRRWADCWAGNWAELIYQLSFSVCSFCFLLDTKKW